MARLSAYTGGIRKQQQQQPLAQPQQTRLATSPVATAPDPFQRLSDQGTQLQQPLQPAPAPAPARPLVPPGSVGYALPPGHYAVPPNGIQAPGAPSVFSAYASPTVSNNVNSPWVSNNVNSPWVRRL